MWFKHENLLISGSNPSLKPPTHFADGLIELVPAALQVVENKHISPFWVEMKMTPTRCPQLTQVSTTRGAILVLDGSSLEAFILLASGTETYLVLGLPGKS